MVTKDAWRTEAPELIRAELEKRLPQTERVAIATITLLRDR